MTLHSVHTRLLIPATATVLGVMALPQSGVAQWTQWGGPNRDFNVASGTLADQWPKTGPPKLWTRPLGEAYSAIVVDDGVLFTMAHADDKERIVALSAQDGTTLWEYAYKATPFPIWDPRFGPGPRATPLVYGDYVYATGVGAMLSCVDKKTGTLVWSHDLKDEYGASPLFWGYSSSPIAYHDTVIVPVGAKGGAVMAFDARSGAVKWKNGESNNGYAAPILIKVGDEEQLVTFMSKEVLGLDPTTGRIRWRYPHATAYDVNASTPIWGPDNILFISSDYGAGAQGLKISTDGDKTTVKQLWHQRKMGIHFGSAVRIGDHIYGSTGNSGASLAAIDVRTGELAWRSRSDIAKASLIHADGKLIIIDEDGQLTLATVSPKGIKIKSRFELFKSRSWTVPTLVGTTLYVRNLKQIVALDLG